MTEDTEKTAQRNYKNSVFCDLFAEKENTLALYRVLHPEDTAVTEDDIQNVTISNVITTDIYNDLGFMVRDRLMIFAEAQATWTLNILVRTLIYLAETYRRYARENAIDLYSSAKAKLPVPELYVIYTGEKDVPEQISLQDDFFDGQSAIDAQIRVIKDSDPADIVGQYIIFTKVVDEQIREKGRTREAVAAAIRICEDRNILRKYLREHEGEVITMTMSLYDPDEVFRISLAAQRREGQTEGILGAINIMRTMNVPEREIAEKIREQYGLSEEEADRLMATKV